jgi:monoamine oxidase
MFSEPGIDLSLSTAVSTISHDANGVTALTLDGPSFVGDALIVATGLNPLAGICFQPPLPEEKAEAVRVGHPGRAMRGSAKDGSRGTGAFLSRHPFHCH